ncbi:MAG: DEAD/DEAH box helicase [Geodermatophilaceae bacterium]|nr:DEAD/DEAH box helicase [Geodermatophilaceae bacterium]
MSDVTQSAHPHPTTPDATPAVVLDHSETGAPDIEAEELAARAPVLPTSPLFADLGVRPETVQALAGHGITRTFAIQELTLPLALVGHDLIGQARTGTGKTLGFGVPILQRVTGPDEGADGVPQALVVVPTRELCVQVARDIAAAGELRSVRTLAIYGGRAYEPQVNALRKGVEIVVGTPGRLLDLAQQGHLILGKVSILVLDEADEMLDLGFLPDIERVLAMVPEARQTMLFSATMPGPIVSLARRFMRQPTHIRAEAPDENRTVPEVDQFVYRAHAMDKIEMLARILQAEGRGLTMVFCRTKRTAQKVADELADRGFAAAAVHGDLGQGAREQALRAFRNGKVDVLVATDVAARGIDVEAVTHVINYQCPEDEKTYLHRIGRTGRAGASGTAIAFVDWDDIPRWHLINTALDLDLADPQETYSTSPHLNADLGIPAGVTGRLPRARRTREGLDAETLEDLGETGRARRQPGHAGGTVQRSGQSHERRRTGSDEPSVAPDRPAGQGRARRRTRSGGTAAPSAVAPSSEPTAPSGAPRRRRRKRDGDGPGTPSS